MNEIYTILSEINGKLEKLLQKSPPSGGGQWLTVEETAKILRISRGHCYELVKTGAIPSVHVGRTVRINAVALGSLKPERGVSQ